MLENHQHIFLVGIKGAAMANLARILAQMGKKVSGSDLDEVFITDQVLKKTGITVITSFEPHNLPTDTHLVIYSAAHGGKDNPQVQEAMKRGVKIVHQAEILGEILKLYKTSIAVCGCHGKTTTSALLAHALTNLQVKPGHMVGTSGFGASFGGEYGAHDYFVIEADEYGINPPTDKTPKLNFLQPTHAICTNIDFDHPDVYKHIGEVKETFKQFFTKIVSRRPGLDLFLCADDENLMDVVTGLQRESYLTFGFNEKADLQVVEISNDEDKTTFSVKNNGITTLPALAKQDVLDFSISLFGEKNISNAAGVVLFLLTQGFSAEAIHEAMKGFTGAKRRFELISRVNDSYLFDDYAHHPQEIEATIKAARDRFPARRLLVIFQPHTFSRTESLKNEFVESLAKADQVLISPIFPSAREKNQSFSITSIELENIAKQRDLNNIKGYNSKDELLESLHHHLQKGDVIFTVGAGDIYKMKDEILRKVPG